jgi:hypothetical protein
MSGHKFFFAEGLRKALPSFPWHVFYSMDRAAFLAGQVCPPLALQPGPARTRTAPQPSILAEGHTRLDPHVRRLSMSGDPPDHAIRWHVTQYRAPNGIVQLGRFPCHSHGQLPQTCPGGAWRSRTAGCPRAPATPQATGSSRPVSDARLIVSTKWCRSTAVSNVGRRLCPVRIASANRAYICPTLNGSPRGKSAGT